MAGFKGQNVRLVVLWARPHDGAAANQSTEGGPEIQSVQRAWSGQGPGWWEFQEKQLRGLSIWPMSAWGQCAILLLHCCGRGPTGTTPSIFSPFQPPLTSWVLPIAASLPRGRWEHDVCRRLGAGRQRSSRPQRAVMAPATTSQATPGREECLALPLGLRNRANALAPPQWVLALLTRPFPAWTRCWLEHGSVSHAFSKYSISSQLWPASSMVLGLARTAMPSQHSPHLVSRCA